MTSISALFALFFVSSLAVKGFEIRKLDYGESDTMMLGRPVTPAHFLPSTYPWKGAKLHFNRIVSDAINLSGPEKNI